MSLILVNSNEIVVGEPIPWSLYDQNRNLLLSEGDQVRDDAHRDALLGSGACHELLLEMPADFESVDDSLFADDAPSAGQLEVKATDRTFTFDDMKLKAEDRLQLEPPAQLTRERFTVKVIGFLRGASLLVSMPITANGLRLQLMEKEKLVMRSFSGQNAFGFACTIERICKIPYEYMHLSFPDNIQGIMIRKAPRVKTRIIAAVQDTKTGAEKQISALISDISANGVSLEARQMLGDKGDVLNLAFRVQLHNIDAYLSLKGVIRAVFTVDPADHSKTALIRHGIEFKDMQVNDSVILQSLIYQQMIENPHKLV
ncbi:flagellar protein YcgR [mine drainage metagenome]|uniref:Flagellar protein YcgR n=1 Tax=mine drainage metagenome TaxID=410659 RepID=A0A1J5SIG3_9ZZZZ